MGQLTLVKRTRVADRYWKHFTKAGETPVSVEITKTEHDALAASGNPSFPAGVDATWEWIVTTEWAWDSPDTHLAVGDITDAWGPPVLRLPDEVGGPLGVHKNYWAILTAAYGGPFTVTGVLPNITVTPNYTAQDGITYTMTDGVLSWP